MQFFVDVINAKRLQNKLRYLKRVQRRKAVREASRESARPLHRATAIAAPKGESGKLKRAVKLRASKKSRTRVGVNVIIAKNKKSVNAFYGSFVEMGTKKQDAQHFMKKTAKRLGKGVQRDFMKRLAKIIREMAKKK